jgi:hypothetical protein
MYGTQFRPSLSTKLFKDIEIKSMFEDTIPISPTGKLLLTDSICLPILKEPKDGRIQFPFTKEQSRVTSLVGAGYFHIVILLFLEKVDQLKHILFNHYLKLLEYYLELFNSDTDNSSIIVSLKIDGNFKKVNKLLKLVQSFSYKLIHSKHLLSLSFSSYVFSNDINFDQILKILSDIISNSPFTNIK